MSDLKIGIQAYEELDFAKAFKILIALARTGEAKAQKIIGHMYSGGEYVIQDDAEAIRWYRLAAEQGDCIAQHNLASYLLDEDINEAIKWYILSAKKDFVFAQDTLGDIYSGILISSEEYRNDLEAVRWYEKAASRGFPPCCHKLAQLYMTSSAIPKNEAEAYKWYQLAADRDYPPSQLILAESYESGLLGLSKDLGKAQFWRERYKLSSSSD
jgi:uncharacterized protein